MIINKNKMNKRIALFTNGNKNYFSKAKRCFEVFEELNPNVFDFYYITSDTEAVPLKNMNVIILDPNDYIEGFTDTNYAPESFLYYPAPDILYEKGYKYSMHIDADCVCMKELDFSFLTEDFVFAGTPRMRNNLSEQIDCWYYLNAVLSKETINYLENTFKLQNKNNIIDIQDGVMIINNERWVNEKLYNKSYNLFKTCKDAGYPMRDTDILLGLLILDTPKHFYKHIGIEWNWYYERQEVKSMGGEDANILHMAWLKPWADGIHNKNHILTKGKEIWDGYKKEDWRAATKDWGFTNI
jgi:lipopolysaccharide biosynthesis glycosyltransferase|tara:strand:- start:235 stop:1128 length:894 start_codon:yes stop_codon:yes gene_type:complete